MKFNSLSNWENSESKVISIESYVGLSKNTIVYKICITNKETKLK